MRRTPAQLQCWRTAGQWRPYKYAGKAVFVPWARLLFPPLEFK